MNNQYVIRLGLDAGNVQAGAAQASRAIGQIGAAGQISARQTAAAMRGLPAQMTDVATQLAGGQNPLLILLQQGGQVKDMFGGIGPAIRGIGSSLAAINPVVWAVGALAAAMATVGAAFVKGGSQARELRDTMMLTGGAAGLTEDRLDSLSQAVAAATQQTVGGARAIAMALAATGSVGSKAIESTAMAVARLSDVTGKSSEDIARDFATMQGGVAKWAAEHNKAWNFITAEQYKYIQRLEEQGKAEEAMIYVNGQVIEHLQDQATNLGYLQTAWNGVGKAASWAWQQMMNLGREDTTGDMIAALQEQIRKAEQRLADAKFSDVKQAGLGLEQRELDRLKQELYLLQEKQKLERKSADIKAASAAAERSAIAKLTGGTKSGKPDEERPLGAIRSSAEQARSDFLRTEKEAYTSVDRFMADMDRNEMARATKAADFIQGLVDANKRANVELVQDDRSRGEQQIELDRLVMQRRIQMMGLTADEQERAMAALEDRTQLARDALSDQLRKAGEQGSKDLASNTYNDVRDALAYALRDSKNPAKAFADALGNVIFQRVTASLADAMATAAVRVDGKGGLWGQILGLPGSIFGGGLSVDTSGAGTIVPPVEGRPRGGMATGTNWVPRDMFALLHRGEAVVPARYNPAGGRSGAAGVTQHITYNLPPGTSPAQMAAAMDENNRRLKSEVASDLARRGRPLNAAVAFGMR